MTTKIGRGATITLTAQFVDGTGAATVADPVLVDILDPSDVEQVTDDSPDTNPATGYYTYDHAVGVSDALGVWTVHWTGVVNGVPVSGDGFFEVVDAGEVIAGDGADTLDVITLLEGYQAINEPTGEAAVLVGNPGTHDDELARAITAISRRLDDLCGPIVKRAVTAETHDGGVHAIELRKGPVYGSVSVTEYDSTTGTALAEETNASKTADDFLIDELDGVPVIRRRASNADSVFPTGRRNVEVTYDVGRYADTASVDRKFKAAAESILRRAWAREQSAWSTGADPFAVDLDTPAFFDAFKQMVAELLADELKPGAVA